MEFGINQLHLTGQYLKVDRWRPIVDAREFPARSSISAPDSRGCSVWGELGPKWSCRNSRRSGAEENWLSHLSFCL